MSATTSAWAELYSAQTEAIELAIKATIGAYAVSKRAILSELTSDEIIVEGGTAENGGFKLQMLDSDFSSAPPKGTVCAVNGSAAGLALEVISSTLNNGIRHLTVGDFAATN